MKTPPPAALRATYSSSSMLPSSIYHKGKTALHSTPYSPPNHTFCTGTCVPLRPRLFVFFIQCAISVLFMFSFRKLRPYCRSERDIASKHTQYSTWQSALHPGSSWHSQTAINSCTQSWASSLCPIHILLYSYLRERSGRRQPPAMRSPCTLYGIQ